MSRHKHCYRLHLNTLKSAPGSHPDWSFLVRKCTPVCINLTALRQWATISASTIFTFSIIYFFLSFVLLILIFIFSTLKPILFLFFVYLTIPTSLSEPFISKVCWIASRTYIVIPIQLRLPLMDSFWTRTTNDQSEFPMSYDDCTWRVYEPPFPLPAIRSIRWITSLSRCPFPPLFPSACMQLRLNLDYTHAWTAK